MAPRSTTSPSTTPSRRVRTWSSPPPGRTAPRSPSRRWHAWTPRSRSSTSATAGSSTSCSGGWPQPEAMTPAPLPRRKPGLTVVFLGVVALGLAAAWLVDNLLPDPGDVAEVGAKAPDFSVELIDGGNFHLGSHLDQVRPRAVVVNLWASWCEP